MIKTHKLLQSTAKLSWLTGRHIIRHAYRPARRAIRLFMRLLSRLYRKTVGRFHSRLLQKSRRYASWWEWEYHRHIHVCLAVFSLMIVGVVLISSSGSVLASGVVPVSGYAT